MAASKRKPKLQKEPQSNKNPSIHVDPVHLRKKPIVWKLGKMVFCEKRKWNWCQLKDDKLKEVFKKLGDLETRTYNELNNDPNCHSIPIENFKNKDVHKELSTEVKNAPQTEV